MVDIKGEPWFLAHDVCTVLGHTNTSVAVRVLGQDEWVKTSLGQRGLGAVIVISESGLYKLVMRSDKPTAKTFQNWVTRVVLPAIRKDGGYILGEENVKTPEDEDALILRAMEVMKRKVDRQSSLLSREGTEARLKIIGVHDGGKFEFGTQRHEHILGQWRHLARIFHIKKEQRAAPTSGNGEVGSFRLRPFGKGANHLGKVTSFDRFIALGCVKCRLQHHAHSVILRCRDHFVSRWRIYTPSHDGALI